MRPRPRSSMARQRGLDDVPRAGEVDVETRRQSSWATASLAPVAWTPAAVTTTSRRPELGLDARDEGADRLAIDDVELAVQRRPVRGARSQRGDREAVGRQPLARSPPQPAAGAGDDRHSLLRGPLGLVSCMAGQRPYRARCGAAERASSGRQIAFSSHRSMRPSIAATPDRPIAAGAVEGARLAQDLGRVQAHAVATVLRRQPLELGQQRAGVAAAAGRRGDEHPLDLGRRRARAGAGRRTPRPRRPRRATSHAAPGAAEVVLGGEDLPRWARRRRPGARATSVHVLGEERLRRRAGRRLAADHELRAQREHDDVVVELRRPRLDLAVDERRRARSGASVRPCSASTAGRRRSPKNEPLAARLDEPVGGGEEHVAAAEGRLVLGVARAGLDAQRHARWP